MSLVAMYNYDIKGHIRLSNFQIILVDGSFGRGKRYQIALLERVLYVTSILCGGSGTVSWANMI